MISKPPIDELIKKTGCKYTLCSLAAKRAREIEEEKNRVDYDPSLDQEKSLSIAAEEIMEGKISPIEEDK